MIKTNYIIRYIYPNFSFKKMESIGMISLSKITLQFPVNFCMFAELLKTSRYKDAKQDDT